MQVDDTVDSTPPAGPVPRSDTRARILAAANDLFYAQGIRATSADRIIEQVGITKVTFYRHFRTKSDLVVAYLQQQAAAERGWIESARHEGDPVGSLRSLATGIGAASCSPGFRGCPFINAAAEFSDPDDPVREAVQVHRDWTRDQFASIAADAGVPDPEATARQLMILRDGAMVNGYLGDPETVADSLGAGFAAILARA
ncbi:TetR family transcriptional regulator [Cnuibacter physcomitrellae]|uniref:TetR family transcriptional regulator n=1 Tax=Cnuibacter physcomitrellae TaxID=1619308 RepID=A0A1X9LQG1_9MICO|nr:TetR/AcrR family transcriptional regulator [Cnuibacter physcomitrellae]ARJ06548.1 TetR family transcriptional regulator [Cnuibacter physcomitrellae]GGI38265.1 TetR family transcriptional regulator [Cnuibacter physcomitrellae]